MGGDALGLSRAVALDKVFALKRHPVLHRDAAAQRFDPLDVAIGDGLAVIEEPVQTRKGNFAIDFFIDVERACDRLIISRVQAKRPTIFTRWRMTGLKLGFHDGRHVRARFEEVLEIRRRKNQHLAGAVYPVEVVACAGLGQLASIAESRPALPSASA